MSLRLMPCWQGKMPRSDQISRNQRPRRIGGPTRYPRRSVPGGHPSYFFCKFVHIFPLDGPTKVPVFRHCARAVSQSATIRGWLAPADDLQLAATSLQEAALAGVMLQSIRSAVGAGAKRRIAGSLLFAAVHTISRRCHRQKAPPAGGPASEAPWGCGCCQRRGTISARDRIAACDRTLDYPQKVKRRRTGRRETAHVSGR